jgi:hypothetical protein
MLINITPLDARIMRIVGYNNWLFQNSMGTGGGLDGREEDKKVITAGL